jgi:hypothetical protein
MLPSIGHHQNVLRRLNYWLLNRSNGLVPLPRVQMQLAFLQQPKPGDQEHMKYEETNHPRVQIKFNVRKDDRLRLRINRNH